MGQKFDIGDEVLVKVSVISTDDSLALYKVRITSSDTRFWVRELDLMPKQEIQENPFADNPLGAVIGEEILVKCDGNRQWTKRIFLGFVKNSSHPWKTVNRYGLVGSYDEAKLLPKSRTLCYEDGSSITVLEDEIDGKKILRIVEKED